MMEGINDDNNILDFAWNEHVLLNGLDDCVDCAQIVLNLVLSSKSSTFDRLTEPRFRTTMGLYS